ncbi:MAG TPA: glycosyl hydrolase family 65 protein [Jatrophihabitans sp.]|nr:glycosyl hydrolase family 65 protein [Jatrophihabitans sp.]
MIAARPGPFADERAPVDTLAAGRYYAALIVGWSLFFGDRTAPRPPAQSLRQLRALLDAGVSVALLAAPEAEPPPSLRRLVETGETHPLGQLLVSGGPQPQLSEYRDGIWSTRGRAAAPAPAGPLPARTVLEIGLRDVLDALSGAGIGPGLAAVVGDRFAAAGGLPGRDAAMLVPEARRCTFLSVDVGPGEPAAVPPQVVALGGGAETLRALLTALVAAGRHRRVPAVDEDPAWIWTEPDTDPRRQRVSETLLSLVAAGIGTRGAPEEEPDGSTPLVLAAGVYTGTGSRQHLLAGPRWTHVGVVPPPQRQRRILDMRTGVLLREELDATIPRLRSLRFASAALPGVVAMRVEAGAGRVSPGPALRGARVSRSGGTTPARAVAAAHAGRGGIAAVAAHRRSRAGTAHTLERMAAYSRSPDDEPDPEPAHRRLDEAQRLGFDRLLVQQRRIWAARWADVDVRIPADPEAQRALRYALFQLRAHGAALDELALGARGLTGAGYAGHVFWDADVFVLPALASMDPGAAQALVEYRLRRLPAARERARELGYAGAHFPWESAADGEDVTPASGRVGAHEVAIHNGSREVHVTADVAWATAFAAAWAGRELSDPERELLSETARYWASRCRTDDSGLAHVDAVIGPDEYHEYVDDNAYTNVMARWNLRAGARATRGGRRNREAARWLELADRIVDGYDPRTGIYEQFAGYHRLEEVLVDSVAAAPIAADVLLGPDRVRRTQLIKQPDVLMLHHLVPEEVAPGSLPANLRFYGPRTAHGSSLSPGISSALLARAGLTDDALRMLRIGLALDLEDRTGTTAAGLHMANLGGVWQSVLTGFAGVRVRDRCLLVEPHLPSEWPEIELRFLALGRRVRLQVDPRRIVLRADGPLRVQVGGGRVRILPADRPTQFPVRRR